MNKSRKSFAALLAAVMLIPVVLAATATAEDQNESDRPAYETVVDESTHALTGNFDLNTLENGRLWTDKSVNTGSVTFHDAYGNPIQTIESEPDEFLITLSNLSQSYNVARLRVPVDTVIIIDLSSSMAIYGMDGNTAGLPGETRDYILVDALNTALNEIMEANPDNRVAVVGYSGTTTYNLLELDHYSSASGIFFEITTTSGIFGGHNVNVSSDVRAESTFIDPLIVEITDPDIDPQIAVNGGTNTQMGIAAGARILLNADTDYIYTDPNSGMAYNRTRQPVMLMMTDGDPTYGWLNYTMVGENGATYTAGNGNPGAGDIGTDLITILTSAYFKQEITQHYYPDSYASATFYTLGVGVNSIHAAAVMDPANSAAGVSHTFSGTAYNLKTLLD
ncbi:MAG: VWA domain-containing protein, partial [Oscillospiraceae bacterium]|nr:VWA domain-containing protein [Oscillospiraceae bacterium]